MQSTNFLESLNSSQQSAVLCSSKSVLILAGAGTGKTRTITSRILHLLTVEKVTPFAILAVTFTNKAANEMKERLSSSLDEGKKVMIKTFHAFGTFLLRAEAKHTTREPNFQILDEDESSSLLKEILKENGLPAAGCGQLRKWIKQHKQSGGKTGELPDIPRDLNIFDLYNARLESINCYDFEDLLACPVALLKNNPAIAEKYRRRFKYILVDEYQDTNRAQYELLKELTGNTATVMVVGDEDQSIYKFRGADINLILNFEHDFEDTNIIRLEENYRSSAFILEAANHIIKNNTQRLGKNLFTTRTDGEPVILFDGSNELSEAEMAVSFMSEFDLKPSETAVLVRTNNQTRAYETLFSRYGLKYRVTGSISFFGREEIKDIVAIAKWLVNPKDSVALNRFINKPARGIGPKALSRFYKFAAGYKDLSLALQASPSSGLKGKALDSFIHLATLFADKKQRLLDQSISDSLLYYFDSLGLYSYYSEKDRLEGTNRTESIGEFLTSLQEIDQGENSDLVSFLETVSLEPSSAGKDKGNTEGVTIMTVHNAKGLEFDNVFIGGLEEGLFPHINSLAADDEIEEERRLFYVALTRARKRLFISYAHQRNIFGQPERNSPSSFIYELPRENLNLKYLQSGPFTPAAERTAEKLFQTGDMVFHKQYGKGKILALKPAKNKNLATIDFFDGGTFELILEYTKLEKVDY